MAVVTFPYFQSPLFLHRAIDWRLRSPKEHAETLAELRGTLDAWIRETNDHGQTPESEEVYDSDMAVYMGSREDEPEYIATLQKNIAQMKAWAKEGK